MAITRLRLLAFVDMAENPPLPPRGAANAAPVTFVNVHETLFAKAGPAASLLKPFVKLTSPDPVVRSYSSTPVPWKWTPGSFVPDDRRFAAVTRSTPSLGNNAFVCMFTSVPVSARVPSPSFAMAPELSVELIVSVRSGFDTHM